MTDRVRALLECVGLTASLVSVIVAGALGARWLLLRFAINSAWREHAILWGTSMVAAVVGFFLFSKAWWAWVHWRRGWRVSWAGEQGRYAYEEYDDGGYLRSLEIAYAALERRYAPPCLITVPGVDEWDEVTPGWAHGRRDAVLERLRVWGGREGWNASVTFQASATRQDQSPA